MSDTRNKCAICQLTRYYLVHWKHDMTCSVCGKIWKIPISHNEREDQPTTVNKSSQDEKIEMKVKSRKRRLSPSINPEFVTILCPNDWCTHQNRITRNRVPTAILEMKRQVINCTIIIHTSQKLKLNMIKVQLKNPTTLIGLTLCVLSFHIVVCIAPNSVK